MNWNKGIRQTHRWVSIVFMLIVIIVSVLAVGQEQPAEWVFYLPLPVLLILMLTGLYLFVLPFVSKGRKGPTTG